MGKLISLFTAAMALAACANPTAPASSDRAAEAPKAKASLAAVANGGQASQTGSGRLSAN